VPLHGAAADEQLCGDLLVGSSLAGQLGDIKAICDVLFAAKINTLYSLRRSRVSDDDSKGPQSDYLELSPVTNDLAVLVPYEVTFYGFSAEIAAVLSGFANEPHGFIVTTLNVEPGVPASASGDANAAGTVSPYGMPATPYQNSPYGNNPYGNNPYANNPYGAASAGAATPASGTPKGSLPVALDERQLKVTMGVSVVKLLSKK